MTINNNFVAILAVGLLIRPMVANAEVVTWEATGTLTSVETSGGFIPEFPTAAIGNPFTLTFAFDTSSPIAIHNTETDFGGGVYLGDRYRYNALVSVNLTIGGIDLGRANDGFTIVDVMDNFAFFGNPGSTSCHGMTVAFVCDGFQIIRGVESSQAGGSAAIGLSLRGHEHLDIFSGPGLPSVPSPLLTSLTTHAVSFSDNTDFINGSVDSVVSISDTDLDGISDNMDNCILIANANQRDTNADGYGNACDPDTDNNNVVNFGDISAWVPFFNTGCGDVDQDFNGDGFCNFGDFALFPEFFMMPPGPSGIAP